MTKDNVTLTIMSVLSALFLTIHVADDIARGMDSAGPSTIFAVLILGVWLFGALVLAGRRSGHIILLLGAILGLGVVALHMSGAGVNRVARSSGGIIWIWTLFALGATSFVALVLSARGLSRLQRLKQTATP